MSDFRRDLGSASEEPNWRATARESGGQIESHGPGTDQGHELILARLFLGIHCDEPFANDSDPERIG